MSPALRRVVLERAEGRCEYCHIHYETTVMKHHVEHIQARQHGGTDELDNLAFACHHCNEYKGPNLTGIDPETSKLTRLFHPRRDQWEDHFEIKNGMMIGISPIGRTTIHLFKMNEVDRIWLTRSSAMT